MFTNSLTFIRRVVGQIAYTKTKGSKHFYFEELVVDRLFITFFCNIVLFNSLHLINNYSISVLEIMFL